MSLAFAPLLLASAFALQPPGQFHGDEVQARDGERWLALHASASGARLEAGTLAVVPAHDIVLDAPGEMSGRQVGPVDDPDVVAYLRGLVPGPVAMGRVLAESHSPLPDAPTRIEWAGGEHRIEAACMPAATPESPEGLACVLEFVTPQGQRQRLAGMVGYREHGDPRPRLGDDAMPTVVFAGDLDRDGKLDLILDTSDHYNVRQPTLFLSSAATAGALLGQVAQFRATGC